MKRSHFPCCLKCSIWANQRSALTLPGQRDYPFFDLLNEIRIGKTISYLIYADRTFEELAEILGCVDSAHIRKAFLEHIGMKANDFRKTYQSIGDKCYIKDRQIFYYIVYYIYRNYAQDM